MDSNLSYYKDKMFFSETVCTGNSGQLRATLMSVFSTKDSSDNKALKMGGTERTFTAKGVTGHTRIPPFAKEFVGSWANLVEV